MTAKKNPKTVDHAHTFYLLIPKVVRSLTLSDCLEASCSTCSLPLGQVPIATFVAEVTKSTGSSEISTMTLWKLSIEPGREA